MHLQAIKATEKSNGKHSRFAQKGKKIVPRGKDIRKMERKEEREKKRKEKMESGKKEKGEMREDRENKENGRRKEGKNVGR